MIWNDDKQKFEDLTADEQRLFDLAYNKGYGQAAKKITPENKQPEVAHNTTFDMSQLEKLMANAVANAVAPLQQELEATKLSTLETKRQSFITQQETKLPPIYENLISGSSESEWQEGYSKAVEQYKADFKLTTNFGAPTPSPAKAKVPTKDFKEMSPAEKIELCKNDPELYAQLRTKA